MSDSCVFCMILDGTIPSIRIHEDDTTLAFMDIHPVQPGHALVIPKAHHPNLFEAPPEVVATTARTAARIGSAIQRALNPPGMNAMNDGMTMNWDLVKGDVNAIEAIAERIRTELANDAG
jgi:histidine triad (HIT) family protein